MRVVKQFALAALIASGCAGSRNQRPSAEGASKGGAVQLKADLVAKFGAGQKARIERGVDQVSALWQESDGDLAEFALSEFIADEAILDQTFKRFEGVLEQLGGHFNEIVRHLKQSTDLDLGPLIPLDPLLAAFDPSAHLSDDLFKTKIAFVALLNFPLEPLQTKLTEAESYSRRKWAELRLTDHFNTRIPAEIQQEASAVGAAAELYIAQYNIWMHHLLTPSGERPFPKGLRLISHWNLRDELKADYADPKALTKQRLIIRVMERIVDQSIPEAVIDNPAVDWDPESNSVKSAPLAEIEEGGSRRRVEPSTTPEPNTRYQHLLSQYLAARKADPYSPIAPTAIARSFEINREIPEAKVVELLTEVLNSPQLPKVAALIEKRLGRKLEPQDLWYNGFQPRSSYSEKQLDQITRKKYPSAQAFAADLPRILQKLGFSKSRAQYLASHIVVDPARGAGHAMPALRRGDFPHLRTRIEKDGMDYKGYNIAIHELGHNVEQVFSLYDVDQILLAGVPNNAFTEALAFVFQARDLELLGLAKPDKQSEQLRALNDFWSTWEIAGVALLDVAVWHWMYDHPKATPAELRDAVVQISKEQWNRFYAPVLGGKDSLLLGIYSHMISYPLYLPDYPLGHLIAFQVEEQIRRSADFGQQFERIAKIGRVVPDRWMIAATGKPISSGPLLRAVEQALRALPAQ
jgi:hypothetical protein